jgi:hypothetical protein
MLGGAIELAMNFSVTHDFIPSVRRKRRIAQVGFLRSPEKSAMTDHRAFWSQ